MLACNTRTLGSQLTGAQRYVSELTSRFGDRIELISPDQPLHGSRGHLWEQFVLPFKVGKRLLWSPSITGPLTIERQVVTIFDVVPLDHPEWLNPRFAAWYRFLTPRLAKKVRSILVISEFTKKQLIYHCPEAASKIKVVHLAADERFSQSGLVAISETRLRLAIPTPHYLVALGSLEPRKNLNRLLQAWAQIESKIPSDIWLVLAGSQGKKMVFGDVAMKELPPRVHLTGHVADALLPALYSGAIASIYPSLYEGFGLPPLEAMACGTPVLTSNVTSLPEVVGNAAITVDPLDAEAIADGLIRLVDDSALRLRLRSLGLKQASQFSWEKTASETWRVLQDAARL